MFPSRVEISQKVLGVVILSLVVFITPPEWDNYNGRKTINPFEEIYSQKVVPLDNLRKDTAYLQGA